MIPLLLERLAGPLLRWAIMALVALALVGGAYVKGRRDGSALSDGAAAKIDAAFWRQQADVADRIAQEARDNILQLQSEAQTAKDEADAYREELKARPDPGCSLTPADVERLRHIGAGRGGKPQALPHASPAR